MRNKKRALVGIFLLLAIVLSSCDFGAREKSTVVDIWYIDGTPCSSQLEVIADEYNQINENSRYLINLISFPSEDALAAALNCDRPGLILVNSTAAFSLYERGSLQDISSQLTSAPAFQEYLALASSSVGSTFFPLGAGVPVLLRNDRLCPNPFKSLESLCVSATKLAGLSSGSALFTVEAFAPVIGSYMLQLGDELHCIHTVDVGSSNYTYVYNLLAEAAYNGGLVASGAHAASLVQRGELGCALISSCSIVGLDLDGLSVGPVPPLSGCNSEFIADVYGLAVTCDDDSSLDYIASFLSWLYTTERASEYSAGSGCLPVIENTVYTGSDKLSIALNDIAAEYAPALMAFDSDYFQNKSLFETDISKSFDYLNYSD